MKGFQECQEIEYLVMNARIMSVIKKIIPPGKIFHA
jgi:hypothetical protein